MSVADLKTRYPGALLLFRMADGSYQFVDPDSKREALRERVPSTIPARKLAMYLRLLLDRGKKVAVCDGSEHLL